MGRCGGCSSRSSRTIPAASTRSSGSTISAACTPTPPRLSAGGIVAYYPTKIPLHHRSAWLGRKRSVRHAGQGLPRAGDARPRAHRSARGARRGARGASGLDRGDERRRAAAALGEPLSLWVTCALGPYNFEFMDQVHREIVSTYQVDGIFANRWAPQGGDCYCVHCEQNFKAATGRGPAAHDGPDAIRSAASISSGATRD